MKNITYINAGAGSGKTYMLTETLANELQQGNYKPSEVILTTFTELAASEFREKARAKLYEHHQPELASQLSAATIGTVHSVALQFIKKYWYLIGVTPDPKVMSEEDMSIYTSQSLASIVTPEQQQFFNGYVDQFNIDEPDFWLYNLKDLTAKISSYGIDLAKSRAISLDAIDRIFPAKQQVTVNLELVEKFQKSMHLFENETAKTIVDAVKQIRSWQLDKNHPISYAIAIDLKNHTKDDGTFRGLHRLDRIKADMGEPDFMALVDNIRDYLKVAPRELMKKMVDTLFDIAENWSKEFNEFKKRNHIIDYNDMERLFLELLDNEAVANEIKGTYRLLLVDEFQDSSPIQIEIFKRLANLMERSYWVGDPKQSIYGFRGTDVELVKELVDQLNQLDKTNGIVVDTLEESWRSRPELVNLVSDCFVRAYEDVLAEDQVKLKPHREEVSELGEPLMHWTLPKGNANAPRYQAIAARVKQLIDSHMCVTIKESDNSKDTRELQPGDIAILCKKNKTCTELAKELKAAGVPVAVVNSDITQQTEVHLVIALLNMVISPRDKHVRADVLHLLDDQSTQDVLCDRLDYLNLLDNAEEDNRQDNWKDDDPLIQRLLTYCKRLLNLSVSDMVQSLIYGLELNEVVAKWGDRIERQQNLATLVELAKQYDQHCVNMGIGAAVSGFISYVFSTEVEAILDNAANAVKVLTYHKAKGLEWSYVILTELEENALEEKTFAKMSVWGLRELREKGGSYVVQYLPRIWGHYKSNLDSHAVDGVKKLDSYEILHTRTVNELRNLLYVGMTRARDYLVTAAKDGSTLNWVANTGISAGNVNDLWQYNGVNLVFETLQAVEFNQQPTLEQRVAYPEHKAVSNELKYLSPSMLAPIDGQIVDVKVVAHLSENRMKHDDVKEENEATFGTCIHNIFAVFDPTVSREENIARAKRIRDGYNLFDTIPDPSEVIDSIELLYKYLTECYGAAVRVEHEVPFVHVLDGQEVHGEIDLLWYTANDTCVLVDFKNFPGKESSLLDPADDKHYAGLYAPQLNAYRDVLTQSGCKVADTLIYYSVLRTLVCLS